MNDCLYIFDCLSGKLRVSDGDFMAIGSGATNTFRMEMEAEVAGSFAKRNHKCHFFPHGSISEYSLNGEHFHNDVLITPREIHLFVLCKSCFIAWYGPEESRPDFSRYDPSRWFVYDHDSREWSEGLAWEELLNLPNEMKDHALATFRGLDSCAFLLSDLLPVAAFVVSRKSARMIPEKEGVAEEGSFLCPSCWSTFRQEDALSIATHPSLYGDSLLGEDSMKRFKPVHFGSQGLPIDERGSLCTEFACPHCHHKLPPFYDRVRQHIFSLVGVPAAGKTYYLTSLIHDLELQLPRDFGISFRDADPTGNAPLNEMRMRVFTAKTPQEAYIGKTRLQGRLYRTVHCHGENYSMPYPFIYTINKSHSSYSLVMYDNAGENYEPARPIVQSIGSDHIKVASAIFFLFDPTTNPSFRALLKDTSDPQLKTSLYPPGRQALMLSEMEIRLRTSLNVHPGEKIDKPLAVIIGKCDTWMPLLGPEPLLPIVVQGKLRPKNMEANSDRLRELLFRICPHICMNAEAISEKVCYFAASSLGAPPVEFRDEETGQTLIGPASGQLTPFRVTDPVIWALSCLEPSLFPLSQS